MNTFGQAGSEQASGQSTVGADFPTSQGENEDPKMSVIGQPGAGVTQDDDQPVEVQDRVTEEESGEEVTEDDLEENDLDEYPEDADYTPRRGDFNWADVQGAVQFALSLREIPYARRARIKTLMGFNPDADIMYMLDKMNPPSGRRSALEFVGDLVQKMSSGSLSFQDGINIATQFQEYEVEHIRRIANLLDLLNEYYVREGEEGVNVRYRKNMDIGATIDLFSAAIDPLDPDLAGKDLDKAGELFDAWVTDY